MKKYFTYISEEEGPFTIEQLKERNTKRDTPVWFVGLPDWQAAGTVEELKELFGATPPPFKKASAAEQVGPPPFVKHDEPKKDSEPKPEQKQSFAEQVHQYRPARKKSRWPWVVGGIVLLIIAASIILPAISKQIAKANFRNSPATYIKVDREFKYNPVLGGISDLKVHISNNSEFSVDEVKCIVTYIRKNGEIYKEEQIVSGYLPAYGNIEVNAPNSSAGMDVNVRVVGVRSVEAELY